MDRRRETCKFLWSHEQYLSSCFTLCYCCLVWKKYKFGICVQQNVQGLRKKWKKKGKIGYRVIKLKISHYKKISQYRKYIHLLPRINDMYIIQIATQGKKSVTFFFQKLSRLTCIRREVFSDFAGPIIHNEGTDESLYPTQSSNILRLQLIGNILSIIPAILGYLQ